MINIVLHKITNKARFDTEYLDDPSTEFKEAIWDDQSEDVKTVKELLYPEETTLEDYASTYVSYLDLFPKYELLIDNNPFEKTYKRGNTRSIPLNYNLNEKIDISTLVNSLSNSNAFLRLLNNQKLNTEFYYSDTVEEKLAIALVVFANSIIYKDA